MRRHKSNTAKKPLKNRRFFILCAVVALLTVISALANSRVSPIVMELAESYGSSAVLEIMNDSVSDFFDSGDFGYSDLVRLRYNRNGFVTSVEYNSAEINKMKSRCIDVLNKNLSKLRSAKIKIPVGSLFNDLTLSGRGPSVTLRVSESAVPVIEVLSTFDSVGVNQSRHEIRMRVTAQVSAFIPPRTCEFSVTQDYVLAQTLIVGEVPSGCAFVE